MLSRTLLIFAWTWFLNRIPKPGPVFRGGIAGAFAILLAFSASSSWAQRVVLGNPQAVGLNASADGRTVKALAALRSQAAQKGSVRVIVGVRAPFAAEGALSASDVSQQRRDIASAHLSVLDKVPSIKKKMQRFDTIPFMALEVDAAELEALAFIPEITYIREARSYSRTLAESVPVVGGPTAWAGGYTGAGQTVAILDTGVDRTHPFLAGAIVSEACYSNTSGYGSVASICPGGVSQSTATGSAMPYGGACPAGQCAHGTHVAGIAAGRGASYSGVAKGAGIIAIQVFSRGNDSLACNGGSVPCVTAWDQDIIAGLERVYALRSTYSIAAVNMSLGGGQYFSQSSCDADSLDTKAAIDNLRSANIATVISSGNNGYSSSLGSPGCISTAVSVGATWDAAGYSNAGYGWSLGTSSVDSIIYYSNSASFLHLLAPGSAINSSIPGSGFSPMGGTSMAAPHVAGAWALLKQKKPSLTVSEGLNALSSTGVSITDPRNGIAKPRIQVNAALNGIAISGTLPSAPTSVSATSGNGSATVSFTPGSLGSGALLYYTANCNGVTVNGSSSPINLTGLGNGVSYTCQVSTTTSVGMGPWSAASNAVVPSAGNDNFPPGGSLPGGWVQPNGSNASWAVTTDPSYSGSLSLRSGAIGHNQTSSISYSATFSAGTIAFARRVSSEANYDFLRFYIDGALQGSWSGEVAWSLVSFPLTAGAHTLLWQYSKDAAVVSGTDAAWIDAVSLPAQAVVVPSAPTIGTAILGDTNASVAFTPGALGSGTLVNYTADCGGITATGGSSPITVTGLTNGVSYTCTVRTTSSVGTSAWSAASNTVTPAAQAGGVNVALAANGGVASASSVLGSYFVTYANDGERRGYANGTITSWVDGTPNVFPDWVQINFNGAKTIDRVVLYTLQNNLNSPVEPTDSMTFSSYGATGYTVQSWNGSAWVTQATVTGNNLVKRSVTFSAVTTDRIRVYVNSSPNGYSYITELEAFTAGAPTPPSAPTIGVATGGNTSASVAFTPGALGSGTLVNYTADCGGITATGSSSPITVTGLTNGVSYTCTVRTSSSVGTSAWSAASNTVTPAAQAGGVNVALAANGGVASASSVLGSYFVTYANDGERRGYANGTITSWVDGTPGVFPDWVQINFNGAKTIDRVVLYTLQNNLNSPVEPTDSMTFSSYGATGYTVQSWNGSAWVTQATVTGNNLVKRSVTFSAVTTDRIRVYVNSSPNGYSYITELEVWTP